MPQQPSSAALAKQFGGRPVAEIAAQFGGKPVEDAAPTDAKPPNVTTAAPKHPLARFGEAAIDAGIGAAKGLASTVLGASQLINRGTEAIGLSKPVRPEAWDAARRDFATPSTTAQHVGFGAEQIAEFLAPFGVGAKAASLAPQGVTAAARATKGLFRAGGEGVELAAKTAAQTGGDPGDVITAALIGGATPTVAKLVSSVGRGITVTLPETLYTKIFKVAHDDIERSITAQAKGMKPDPTLASELLHRGLHGNARSMGIYVIKKGAELEQQLQQHVAGKMVKLPNANDYIDLLDEVAGSFGSTFSNVGKEAKALSMRLKLFSRGGQIPATDALKLKRLLDQSRSSASFRLNPTLSPKQDQFRQAADTVRRQLHFDQTTSELLNEERIMIEAKDALVDNLVKSGNRPLVDLFDRLVAMGGLTMPLAKGPAIATTAGVRAARSPFMLTNIGSTLHWMRRFAPKESTAAGMLRAGSQPVVSSGGR